jgi:hypothetical protein
MLSQFGDVGVDGLALAVIVGVEVRQAAHASVEHRFDPLRREHPRRLEHRGVGRACPQASRDQEQMKRPCHAAKLAAKSDETP